MAKYKVLRPIEHNLRLYLAADAWPQDGPKTIKSAGHGNDIPVDTGGIIELSDAEAAAMTAGQIEPIKKTTGSTGDTKKNK